MKKISKKKKRGRIGIKFGQGADINHGWLKRAQPKGTLREIDLENPPDPDEGWTPPKLDLS